jgi:hypothetical protein
VDKTIPLTWQVRWRTIRVGLPLVVFSSVCFAEIIFIQSWCADKMAGVFPWLIFGLLFPPVLLLVALEVEVRLRHQQKRRLVLKKRGLVFQPGDSSCPWRAFAGLRFNPIPEQPHLKRCDVLVTDRRKPFAASPRWSLALDAAQQQALTQAVPIYRPASLGDFCIEELQTVDSPIQQYRVPFKAVAVYVLGLYLFLHGAPLTFVFYDSGKPRPREHTSDFVVTERRSKQMGQFIIRHFHSLEEFRAWGFWTGTSLVVLGLSGIGVGSFMLRRPT